MSQERVARRYAEALLGSAADAKREEQVAADMDLLRNTIHGSRDLLLLLKSPVLRMEQKLSALRSIFEAKVQPVTMDFLRIVVEKRRESAIPEMVEEFLRLRDERLGIITVEVVAAADLSGDQNRKLQEHFESVTRKKVRITFSIDKAVKGGFRARVGDTVFDGTISRQLELLRKRLNAVESIN
ncbi:MAG: ATP synthase F1 subunit delta [Ignavibacteria bacterium GWA2_55_11]|nr:MAG: ATP synthase F1 subunit delta [Ignavibacteria bacterium GWA2_55_11]